MTKLEFLLSNVNVLNDKDGSYLLNILCKYLRDEPGSEIFLPSQSSIFNQYNRTNSQVVKCVAHYNNNTYSQQQSLLLGALAKHTHGEAGYLDGVIKKSTDQCAAMVENGLMSVEKVIDAIVSHRKDFMDSSNMFPIDSHVLGQLYNEYLIDGFDADTPFRKYIKKYLCDYKNDIKKKMLYYALTKTSDMSERASLLKMETDQLALILFSLGGEASISAGQCNDSEFNKLVEEDLEDRKILANVLFESLYDEPISVHTVRLRFFLWDYKIPIDKLFPRGINSKTFFVSDTIIRNLGDNFSDIVKNLKRLYNVVDDEQSDDESDFGDNQNDLELMPLAKLSINGTNIFHFLLEHGIGIPNIMKYPRNATGPLLNLLHAAIMGNNYKTVVSILKDTSDDLSDFYKQGGETSDGFKALFTVFLPSTSEDIKDHIIDVFSKHSSAKMYGNLFFAASISGDHKYLRKIIDLDETKAGQASIINNSSNNRGRGGIYFPYYYPIYYLTKHSKNLKFLEEILGNYNDIKVNTSQHLTPLENAIILEDLKMISLLISKGATVRKNTYRLACIASNAKVYELILDQLDLSIFLNTGYNFSDENANDQLSRICNDNYVLFPYYMCNFEAIEMMRKKYPETDACIIDCASRIFTSFGLSDKYKVLRYLVEKVDFSERLSDVLLALLIDGKSNQRMFELFDYTLSKVNLKNKDLLFSKRFLDKAYRDFNRRCISKFGLDFKFLEIFFVKIKDLFGDDFLISFLNRHSSCSHILCNNYFDQPECPSTLRNLDADKVIAMLNLLVSSGANIHLESPLDMLEDRLSLYQYTVSGVKSVNLLERLALSTRSENNRNLAAKYAIAQYLVDNHAFNPTESIQKLRNILNHRGFYLLVVAGGIPSSELLFHYRFPITFSNVEGFNPVQVALGNSLCRRDNLKLPYYAIYKEYGADILNLLFFTTYDDKDYYRLDGRNKFIAINTQILTYEDAYEIILDLSKGQHKNIELIYHMILTQRANNLASSSKVKDLMTSLVNHGFRLSESERDRLRDRNGHDIYFYYEQSLENHIRVAQSEKGSQTDHTGCALYDKCMSGGQFDQNTFSRFMDRRPMYNDYEKYKIYYDKLIKILENTQDLYQMQRLIDTGLLGTNYESGDRASDAFIKLYHDIGFRVTPFKRNEIFLSTTEISFIKSYDKARNSEDRPREMDEISKKH